MSQSVPSVKLNDGSTIPIVGFGTGTAHFKQDCTDHVKSALETGYTYLDGAYMYGNASSIGDAIKARKGGRDGVYVLTKCGKDGEENDPRQVLSQLLKEMGIEYVDMYLIHSPLLTKPLSLVDNWKVMEQLKKEGLTKSIGVSNYREEDILAISKTWEIPPAVNQIEFHPYVAHAPNMQRLLAVMAKHDIKVQAYGPLSPIVRFAGGPVDTVVQKIAAAKGQDVTESQVLLAWAAQTTEGIIVTTSRNQQRQKEQLEFSKVKLDASELEAIANAGKGKLARNFMQDVWNQAKE